MFSLVAGHETTASLIANGLRMLLDDDDLRDLLIRRPDLLPAAIEEFLEAGGADPILASFSR